MTNEISKTTMLSIVLVALAVVIGLAFGVFLIAREVTVDGSVKVVTKVSEIEQSIFEDYKDTIVTGNTVIKAYEQFKGKPVAILINTQAMNKGVGTYKQQKDRKIQTVGTKSFINYNAILSNDGDGKEEVVIKINGGDSIVNGNTDVLLRDSFEISSKYGFVLNVNGQIVYDHTVGGFHKQGNSEYIDKNTKFTAEVIKDMSGIVVGVAFTQM